MTDAVETLARRPGPARLRAAARDLFALPVRAATWRHVLYALVLPLPLAVVVALRPAMMAAQDHGVPALGTLLLFGALAAVAVAGPALERRRLRWFLGEPPVPPRKGRTVRRTLLFFLANTALSTLSCAAAGGWLLVSARNLTYPVWGWEPYPTEAWGGPTPLGAVALHFAAGVAAFLVLPRILLRLTALQRDVARRLL